MRSSEITRGHVAMISRGQAVDDKGGNGSIRRSRGASNKMRKSHREAKTDAFRQLEISEPRKRQQPLPIGDRIKTRRKEMGLTLQELAARSELSAPFISQAERDLTTPSLWSLMSLARALEVDISYFMALPHTDQIVFRADEPNRIDIGSVVEYVDLASDLPDRKLDAVLVRIPPGFAFPSDFHNGEIFRYVISGELFAVAGDVETILRAGDGMHFDGRMSHFVRNDSGEDVLLLYVGTPAVLIGGAMTDPERTAGKRGPADKA
jgi:transcriptional regulator with XRE-family HTH domain